MHELSLLENISPQKRKQFEAKKIGQVEDLAYFFPKSYKDYREITLIKDVKEKETFLISGTVINKSVGNNTYSLEVKDSSGTIRITWFHIDYIFNQFQVGSIGYFAGSVTSFNFRWSMANPEIATTKANEAQRIFAKYSKIKGMSDEYLKKSITEAILYLEKCPEDVDKSRFAAQYKLPRLAASLREVHAPTNRETFANAKTRTDFEKIWDFCKGMHNKSQMKVASGVAGMTSDSVMEELVQSLPFTLTEGQENALSIIKNQLRSNERLNTLVSGDVGCGKTIVAILIAVLMAENGYQTAILAPTVVLATQHLKEFEKFTKGILIKGKPISIGFITGKTGKRDRTKIGKALSSGDINILIGTHAVLSDDLEYQKLGMLIVDEEHKFGVAQKEKITLKSGDGIHYLSMTATPIPRSIALTVYGDGNSIIPIKTKPNGRKPIITRQCKNHEDAFELVMTEIEKGRQAYIIAPFIEKSEDEAMKDVVSVAEAEAMFKRYVKSQTQKPMPKICSINGKMTEAEISENIKAFENHQADVLISTTIVEVGVNVPNATAICIMSAGRFGLAGLHQLRGRVGRNSEQGYCLLCEGKDSARLDIICSSTDGFEIAEADLELRGPGDLLGDDQNGMSEMIELILERPNMTKIIREYISNL